MKSHKSRSVRNQLLATIVFAAVYPIILVVIVGIMSYENVVKERFFDSASSEMALVSNHINQDVEDMNTFMIGLLSDQGLYDLINQQDDIQTELDRYNFNRDVETYLRSSISSREDFDVVGLYLYKDEHFYWNAKRTGVVTQPDIPYMAVDEILQNSVLKTVYYSDKGIYLARKILDKDTLNAKGIIMFRIDPGYLKNIVGYQEAGAISTNYLVTKEGVIIANSGDGGHSEFIQNHELYYYDKGNYELTFDKTDYYASISETELLDFALIRLTTKDELLKDLRKVTDLIVILSVVNIPLYIFLGNLLYKHIMTPVDKLVEGMGKFENGHMDVHIDSKRKDEFGYMIGTFNSMTVSMNKLINEVYIEELARKDAEISALQEQINPHFLYNTLESINWRAQLAGQEDIAEMVQALSVIMDANINRSQEKRICLREELIYMDKYIYLIQMRLGDKIVYEKNISDEAMDCMIPKMIIQPFLENAIKHGIEPIGLGKISFNAYIEDQLVVVISDTGKGMNHATRTMVRRILEQEEKGTVIRDEKRSIGLRNVVRRLYLLYGDDVTIDVVSAAGEGTTVTLRLPIKKKEN